MLAGFEEVTLVILAANCLVQSAFANVDQSRIRRGPIPRRRIVQDLERQAIVEDAPVVEILREGKNLASIFPFVGGERDAPRPIPIQRRGGAIPQFRDQAEFHDANNPPPLEAHNQVTHAHNQVTHNHVDHEEPEEHQLDVDVRPSRQGQGDDIALDIGSIAAAGERCIDKVVMVEETEYDEQIQCHHSYTERCHTTYTTDFEPTQEEECEENFKKDCFIDYKKIAFDEAVRFCHTPFVCEGEGPVECKTVYESQCETRYHEHDVEDDVVECETVQEEKCEDISLGYTTEQKCTKWPKQVCNTQRQNVKKYTPETDCKKVARELCGPSGCLPQPGPEECFDKKETVVQEVPEETCNLEPQRSCKHVTKLVPVLKPSEECVDIPKEVCSRSRANPRKVKKPVVKKWCYVPSEQSGLA
eukprot:maker-scaffold90_size386344-snap-gene-1.24 protein:Tk12048 transcript:maker-scaffold90_size386344-snap-gene-1.24-mRNA-1 annotation:"hypothetical protein"